MKSDRIPAAQHPFWPGLMAKAEKAERTARAARASQRRRRRNAPAEETAAERAVRERLQGRMGARVDLKDNKGRGSFTVHFGSYDQLDEIMRRIDA
jgi:hypothetical protein